LRDYNKYDVWNSAVEFSTEIYLITKSFPDIEKFGITNQLRRASVSIPSNIAEGCGRSSEKDFARFLEFSLGSTFEVKTQLVISKNLKYLSEVDYDHLIEKSNVIAKQLSGLIKSIKNIE
jgi:four helix bundle protein